MDPIKEAFSKIKEEIALLKKELSEVKESLFSLQNSSFYTLATEQTNNQTHFPTHAPSNSSFSELPFNQQTNSQTQKLPFEPFKAQNIGISIGNEGVPTNKPTNEQTNSQTQILPHFAQKDSDFKKANEILSSLDTVKEEIKIKFKKLTPQEMVVFSTLYLLEDEKVSDITYRTLANKLNLSESSIRDYVIRLINKGIPIEKIKQNNKTILLKISLDLKNIASLATIIQLRRL